MKSYEFALKVSYPCGGEEKFDVKLTAEELRTEQEQPGVVVILDGLGERKMGVSLKHPQEEGNFWRGVRYAIFRLGLPHEEARELYRQVVIAEGNKIIAKLDACNARRMVEEYFRLVSELYQIEEE